MQRESKTWVWRPGAGGRARILLVRHTSVAVEAGLCYGRAEVPLASTFEREAAAVAERLPGRPWRLASSPSGRCLSLAMFLGGPDLVDERLSELDFGSWEGRPWNGIPRAESEEWSSDFVNVAPPGGESFASLAQRAERCVASLEMAFAGELVVCVTHGGVIRALMAARRGMRLADAFALEVPFGSVFPL